MGEEVDTGEQGEDQVGPKESPGQLCAQRATALAMQHLGNIY